ncbi:unnamed protein product [Closterium sp. NIES-54]
MSRHSTACPARAPPCWPPRCPALPAHRPALPTHRTNCTRTALPCPRAALLAAALPCHLRCPALAARRSSLAVRRPALPCALSLVLVLRYVARQLTALYLLSNSRDSVSLFDHTSGASLAPPATAESATRSQWLTRDGAARLTVRNHLPLAECAHFGQHKTTKALYDAVVARFSSPATDALGRLILPYLFPELSTFATIEDLITHLRTSNIRYRAALAAEFVDKNPPPMDHFLTLDPTDLTLNLLEKHLLAAETSTVAVGAARGTPRTPFFEGCSPSPLAPSYASAATIDILGTEDIGAASVLSGKCHSGKGKGGKSGGDGNGGGGSGGGGGGGGGSGSGGGSGGFGGGCGGSGNGGGPGGAVQRGGDRAGQTCGKFHTQHRCFYRLEDAWRVEFGDEAERPRCLELLRSGVVIFALDYDAILAAIYALTIRAEGDCYLCVPPNPSIEAAALGASESVLLGIAPAEAVHTIMLDSGASRCFFRDGLHLPSFSTNLVSTDALQDAMVTTTTPGGQSVSICTCTRTGRHLATFTRRPGSSLYTLTTEPPPVAASGQHQCLGHPSLPRLRGMHSCLLFSGLPRSLPPLPPSPAPPCLTCVEGRQRTASHSFLFPLTTAPLQTLHMDVWGPACVSGQDRKHYILLSVSSSVSGSARTFLSRVCTLTEVVSSPLNSCRTFFVGRASSNRSCFRPPPNRGGVAERRIGLVMEVARSSMIHAAAPQFLWPFGVQYAMHHLNLWPHVSLPETLPTLPLTGKVGDASVFRVDPPPLAQPVDVTVDSGAARGAASGGAEPAGAEPGGVEPASAERGGAEPEGAEPGGAESQGAESGGAEPAGANLGVLSLRVWSQGVMSLRVRSLGVLSLRVRSLGGAEPRGAASARGPAGTGGAGATGPGGARTRGTGAARAGGVGGAGPGAGDPGAGDIGAGDPRAGDPRARGPGAGGAGAGDPGAGGAGAGDPGAGGPGARGLGVGGAGAGDPGVGGAGAGGAGAGGTGAGGTVQRRPFFVPPPSSSLPPRCLSQPQLQPDSPLPAPSPYAEQTDSLTKRREPESCIASPVHAVCTGCRVPRPSSSCPRHLHYGTSSFLFRAGSPTVLRLLATIVTDPSFKSAAASVLVAELLDFAAACRLDYAASLVAESESNCSPSIGGALPHLVAMLLAPEGDPDAPDISTPRSYEEATTGPYSSYWQIAMDAEMASWTSTGTYVDAVPPSGENIVDGMWIFRVKRPHGSPPVFKARYVARGFSQRQGVDFFQTFSPTPKMTTLRVLLHDAAQRDYRFHSLDFSTAFLQGSLHDEIWLRRPPGFTGSFPTGTQRSLRQPAYGLHQAPLEWHDTQRRTLAALGFAPWTADPSLFLRTDTLLPPFYILVYVDDLVFATAETEALALVKSELQKRHTCTDLGELRSYLGLQITRDRARRTITLTQSHMVHQVLQRFGFRYSSPQSTPLPTGHSLSAPPSDESVEPSGLYPELVGCLMYLTTCTRPCQNPRQSWY